MSHVTSNPGEVIPNQRDPLFAQTPSKSLPTLSPFGWITDPVNKLDYLWCHFFEADAGLSYLNPNTTYNIQDIFGTYRTDPRGFVNRLEEVLRLYFQSFFQEAEVVVEDTSEKNDDPGMNVTITAKINVIENGMNYGIDQVVNYRNNKFNTVLRRNNYGTE